MPEPVTHRELSDGEKQTLLTLARAAIRQALLDDGSLDRALATADLTDALRERRGAFVTLEKPDPDDRADPWKLAGCIGSLEPTRPLFECVIHNAVQSALHDPRFPPTASADVGSLRVSISALTPIVPGAKPDDIVAGRDGVVLERGSHRSVFLPQVAAEQGWDRTQLLEHLALKAGLRRDQWTGAKLSVFRAESFGESG